MHHAKKSTVASVAQRQPFLPFTFSIFADILHATLVYQCSYTYFKWIKWPNVLCRLPVWRFWRILLVLKSQSGTRQCRNLWRKYIFELRNHVFRVLVTKVVKGCLGRHLGHCIPLGTLRYARHTCLLISWSNMWHSDPPVWIWLLTSLNLFKVWPPLWSRTLPSASKLSYGLRQCDVHQICASLVPPLSRNTW